MSRILLVNPPFYRLLGSHYNSNSLGIAYIASYLNERGHDAWLYNADFVNQESYADLSGLYTGFEDYKEYFQDEDADIWNEVAANVIAFEPEWVGYTSYTANISAIDIISKKVRRERPNIKQVVGGVHATLDSLILHKLPAIAFTVRREGEKAMCALVDGEDPALITGVISRKGSSELVFNGDADVIQDIDSLPYPERDKFYMLSEEEKLTVDISYICTIRGCPYRCNYCASPFHWKRDKTQFRTPDSVISEMHYIKDNYWSRGTKYDYSASANASPKNQLIIEDNTMVYFVDDVFTVRKRRVKEVLRRIVDEKLEMPWKCEARTDHLDEEICRLMAKAGCKRVKLGFESGSDRILLQIQKDETKEDMRRGARLLKDAGVPFTAYFMTGFPGETDEDLKQTVEFAKEINADYYSLSILAPYFGTKMYYDLMEQGFELDKQPWEYFFHQTGERLVNDTLSEGMIKEYLSLNQLNAGKDAPESEGYV